MKLNPALENKFSIPFTGDNPLTFVGEVMKRRRAIKEVYLGFTKVFPQFIAYDNENATTKLLSLTRRLDEFPALVFTANSFVEPNNLNQLIDFLTEHKFEGVICTKPSVAIRLLRKLPELKVYSSVNSTEGPLDWPITLEAYQLKREERSEPSLLKKLKDRKIKTKVMLNESCYAGCPRVNAFNEYFPKCDLEPSKLAPNYVLEHHLVTSPQRLVELAELIDVAKIVGKNKSNEWLFRCLDAYAAGEPNTPLEYCLPYICHYHVPKDYAI